MYATTMRSRAWMFCSARSSVFEPPRLSKRGARASPVSWPDSSEKIPTTAATAASIFTCVWYVPTCAASASARRVVAEPLLLVAM